MVAENIDKIIEINPLKDDRWDEFVENHPFGWLCHHSGWKRVLEKSFKHMKGHYFVITNGGLIKAALPVYEVNSWLFGRRLVSVPFATLFDPLISTNEEMDILCDGVLKLMHSKNASYIEIRTLFTKDIIKNEKLSVHPFHKHHYIKLDSNPEKLMKNFHRSCVRQKIFKSLKNNLTLKECKSKEDLKEFYNLHLLTRKERQGLPPKPYIFFKSLWEEYFISQNVSVLLCKHENKTIGGVMLFKFKKRVSIEIAAYLNEFVHLNPMHYLFWQAIQIAYRDGYEIIDFGSTPPTNKGLMDFKKRWATTVTDLTNYYYPPKGIEDSDKTESRGYKVLQKISKRMPNQMLKMIGRIAYRHLG